MSETITINAEDVEALRDKGSEQLSLLNYINASFENIISMKDQLKEEKIKLDSFKEGDPEYVEVAEKIKELQKKKKAITDRILKDPAAAEIKAKMSDIRQDIKYEQQGLSEILLQYSSKTGNKEFTDRSGKKRKIVHSAKVK